VENGRRKSEGKVKRFFVITTIAGLHVADTNWALEEFLLV
jgi:hypothetical protein